MCNYVNILMYPKLLLKLIHNIADFYLTVLYTLNNTVIRVLQELSRTQRINFTSDVMVT